ncbi:hypothetical protein A2U01_0078606, partial [Trifolium medium]|nr:hypothetical protein [Trifolium medium]
MEDAEGFNDVFVKLWYHLMKTNTCPICDDGMEYLEEEEPVLRDNAGQFIAATS